MKNALTVQRKKLAAAIALAPLVVASHAQAALPAAVTDMLTGLVADVALIFAACVTLWVAILTPSAIMRLVNKFKSKAGA